MNWIDRLFVAIGWIALTPFLIRDAIVALFKWFFKKIKK
tara:strand:+ start:677 stop:793 length:117 start_codon:yes stop_codon:yes gene_type:complete